MEIENQEVVAVEEEGTTTEETTEVEAPETEAPTTEAPVSEEVPEFNLDEILRTALEGLTEDQTQNNTKEEVIPTRPSFDNKPVTEKELEEINSKFESLISEKEKSLVEKEDTLTQKEIQIEELSAKMESLETEHVKAQSDLEKFSEFFSKLESTPIIGEIAVAISQGKEVNVPQALRAYAEQLKSAATTGSQSQVSVPAKPTKSTTQRLSDLTNNPYIR